MRGEWNENRRKVAQFLRAYIDSHGRAPSLEEIAKGTGMWKRSVEIVLRGLEKIGFLELTPGISRGIRLLESLSVRVPLLGEVQAGPPALSDEVPTEFLRIDPRFVRFDHPVALKVEGFSMKDAGILPGDLVLLRPQREAVNGDTVVAWYQGGLTVKVFERKGRAVQLKPCNPSYKTIEVQGDEEFAIVGKVMVVLRDLGDCIDVAVERST